VSIKASPLADVLMIAGALCCGASLVVIAVIVWDGIRTALKDAKLARVTARLADARHARERREHIERCRNAEIQEAYRKALDRAQLELLWELPPFGGKRP